jgi:hypothetical protein
MVVGSGVSCALGFYFRPEHSFKRIVISVSENLLIEYNRNDPA